jgi:CO/xanthine dehydrogenase FAD-binding subunit
MGRTYAEPGSIADAVALAAQHGSSARFLAGGTDLVVLARKRRQPLPPALIAIHRLAELRGVEELADGSLQVGTAVTQAELETHPAVLHRFTALADGAALVGSPATRHVATLGGNLCNGSPAMDTGSPLLVFGASVTVRSKTGSRDIPLAAFFEGPGRTAASPGELVTSVRFPALPPGAVGSAYVRLDYRLAMEIAVVGAAALVVLADDGRVAHAHLALTAVAPTCVSAPEVAVRLQGAVPDDEVLRRAAQAAANVARPIDDVRAPAGYRQAMVPIAVHRALTAAVRRARGEPVAVPATLTWAGEP